MSYYGDGTDGVVALVSQAITLTRNMWYESLSLDVASSIDPAGYDINVSGTLDNSGIISRDGAAGTAGDVDSGGNQIPGTGGAALASAHVGGSGAGGDGGGASAVASESVTRLGGSGGSGGTGGTGATGGGNTGASGATGARHYEQRPVDSLLLGTTLFKGGAGGGGGGRGGPGISSGGFNNIHLAGGGGGAGGGIVRIRAATFINRSSGIVSAAGGAGGAGSGFPDADAVGTAPQFDSLGGGAGGGGGGGGWVEIVTDNYTNDGTVSAPGGAGGAGGVSYTPGLRNGAAGSDGSDGVVRVVAERFNPSAPGDLDHCVVYGVLLDASGSPIEAAAVTASTVVPDSVQNSQLSDNPISTVTDEDGLFELELLRGAVVRFTCDAASVDFEQTIPDQSTKNFADWTT